MTQMGLLWLMKQRCWKRGHIFIHKNTCNLFIVRSEELPGPPRTQSGVKCGWSSLCYWAFEKFFTFGWETHSGKKAKKTQTHYSNSHPKTQHGLQTEVGNFHAFNLEWNDVLKSDVFAQPHWKKVQRPDFREGLNERARECDACPRRPNLFKKQRIRLKATAKPWRKKN